MSADVSSTNSWSPLSASMKRVLLRIMLSPLFSILLVWRTLGRFSSGCVPLCQLSQHRHHLDVRNLWIFLEILHNVESRFIIINNTLLLRLPLPTLLLFYPFNSILHNDHQMLVQREWFALEILPSSNILSQTLTNTWNFSSRVRVSAPSHCDMILIICAFEVIILNVDVVPGIIALWFVETFAI